MRDVWALRSHPQLSLKSQGRSTGQRASQRRTTLSERCRRRAARDAQNDVRTLETISVRLPLWRCCRIRCESRSCCGSPRRAGGGRGGGQLCAGYHLTWTTANTTTLRRLRRAELEVDSMQSAAAKGRRPADAEVLTAQFSGAQHLERASRCRRAAPEPHHEEDPVATSAPHGAAANNALSGRPAEPYRKSRGPPGWRVVAQRLAPDRSYRNGRRFSSQMTA